jgi:hypothetical protein
MEMETFDRHSGHHLLRADEDATGQSAAAVMEEAGALFDVFYPPSGWERPMGLGMEFPLVERGKNARKPLHKYVVRSDTEQVLGLHSHSYAETPGGYRFIAEIADALFPDTTIGCTLFGCGEKVAVTQRLDKPIDLGDGDWIQPEILWVTSMNGQWATAVHDSTMRFFCQNQIVSSKPLFKVKHTVNHDNLVEMRICILEKAMERSRIMANMARVLKDRSFTNEQFSALVHDLVPKDIDTMPTRAFNEASSKHDAMWNQWFMERDQFSSVDSVFDSPGNNCWQAYNAVQGAEQHVINSTVRRRRCPDRALEKAIDGKTPLADRALRLLLPAGFDA